MSLEGAKVVTAAEMTRLEKKAIAAGASEQLFMEKAGHSVAAAVQNFVQEHGAQRRALLLIGKGNNGGDACAAGVVLKESGFAVSALLLFPGDTLSPLCKLQLDRLQAAGVVPTEYRAENSFPCSGVIIDGLTGTGCKGKAEGELASLIEEANSSGLPILSIDLPSGVQATDGSVETVAIHATATIYLELPKLGLFMGRGWDHSGELLCGRFGLDSCYQEEAKAEAALLCEEELFHYLPKIKRSRHKYEAGYLLAFSGSPSMPGAALLTSYAALRAGAGIVRLIHPLGMEAELSAAPAEIIRQGWALEKEKSVETEIRRAKAAVIGPGMGRDKSVKKALAFLFTSLAQTPVVLDADALFFLAQERNWRVPKKSVLTPHHQEMRRLLDEEELSLHSCQAYAERKGATVVLKGAPTMIFHPETTPLIATWGDPGMATAGAGDVLSGIIAALLAQGAEPRAAAALGVYLQGVAGECAAQEKGSRSLIASDLIEFLPQAFAHLERYQERK